MLNLPSPTAVICHDAGSANLIISWLKADSGVKVQAYMQGPAAQLWDNAFPHQPLCDSLHNALHGARTLLSGTGWASDLEHNARQIASTRSIRNIAVLDHWVNYVPRFEREGVLHWPDEIWVADSYALELAQHTLPGIQVRQLENIYLNDQVSRIGAPPANGTVLVMLEPVRNSWGRDRQGEFQALDYLIEHLDYIYPDGVTKVILRQHPSEPPGKYRAMLEHNSLLQMDTSRDVAAAVSQADVVAGVESFSLTIALAAGRPVYTSLPPWAPELRLPQTGIRQIRHLVPLLNPNRC